MYVIFWVDFLSRRCTVCQQVVRVVTVRETALALYCPQCAPCLARRPFLVQRGVSPPRTAENCLELAVASRTGLFFTVLFSPGKGGNGPYFADEKEETLLRRLVQSPVSLRHWATIARRDTPLYLHLDLDRSWEAPDNAIQLCGSAIFFLNHTRASLFPESTAWAKTDWMLCETQGAKMSVHMHAMSLPFLNIKHVKLFMKKVITAIETGLQATSGTPECNHAKALTRMVEGKIEHVVDMSIYHHNALLKLPFSSKPGRSAMLPFYYRGARIDPAEAQLSWVRHGLWHTTELMQMDTTQCLKCEEPVLPLPAPRSANLEGVPALLSVENSQVQLVIGFVRSYIAAQEPGCGFTVNYVKTTEEFGSEFYIKFEGARVCPISKSTHDSNNATVCLKSKTLTFRCFSLECKPKGALRLGVIPISLGRRALPQPAQLEAYQPMETTPDGVEEAPTIVISRWQDDPMEVRTLNAAALRPRSEALQDQFDEYMEQIKAEATPPDWEDPRSIKKYYQSMIPHQSALIEEFKDALCRLVRRFWAKVQEGKTCFLETRWEQVVLPVHGDMSVQERTLWVKRHISRTEANHRTAWNHLVVLKPKLKKSGVVWESVPLVDLWLKSEAQAVYTKLVSEPHPEEVQEHEFNLWTGFTISEEVAEEYVKKHNLTPDAAMKILQPYFDHFYDIIGNGNTTHSEYNLNWFSFVLQKKQKTGVALLWTSNHGAGKSCILEILSQIVGLDHCSVCTRSEDLVGNFNSHMAKSVLVVSEEATFGGDRRSEGCIKNLVTADRINVHEKFQSVFSLKSRHNVVFCANRVRLFDWWNGEKRIETSSKSLELWPNLIFYVNSPKEDDYVIDHMFSVFHHAIDPFLPPVLASIVLSYAQGHVLRIAGTERRYACFPINNRYCGLQTPAARAYFDKIRAIPPQLVAWYHYRADITGFEPRLDIPVTDVTREQKVLSMETTGLFLYEILSNVTENEWKNNFATRDISAWFSHYGEWCKERGIFNFHREPLQSFQKFMRMALAPIRHRRRLQGTRIEVFRLHHSLEVNKMKFAAHLQCKEFEEIGLRANIDPQKMTPVEVKDQRLEKKRRLESPLECPRECDGLHPRFVRILTGGHYTECLETDAGAVLYHDLVETT